MCFVSVAILAAAYFVSRAIIVGVLLLALALATSHHRNQTTSLSALFAA